MTSSPTTAEALSAAPRLDPREVRLITIDLDGTLLDSAKRLDPAFPALHGDLVAAGITVVPASGRQVASIQRDVPPVPGTPLTVIGENGAIVVRGEEALATDPVPRDALAHVLDATETYRAGGGRCAVVLCGRNSAYVTDHSEEFMRVTAPYYPLLEQVHDLHDVNDDVLKIAVWDPDGSEHGVAEAIGEVPGARTLVSAGVWVDIMSPTADKGHALKALQAELGVGPEQTMAFGDYPNDLGMLARARYSFAMADAHPSVAQTARYRAPSNDDGGVVRTIRTVLGL